MKYTKKDQRLFDNETLNKLEITYKRKDNKIIIFE